MSNVPVALNIFNNGKMWKTRRVSGVWEPETLWFTDPAVGPSGPQQFSSNSIVSSLSDLSTLVFTSGKKLYFVDSTGTRTLVSNITATSGLTSGFRPLSTQWDQYWGPLSFGGTYFFFGGIFRSGTFNFRLAAYSGPETGTATEENLAGSPVYGDGFTDNFGGLLGIFWDGASNNVFFALVDPVSFYKVKIYQFDMGARTWSSVLTTFDAGTFVEYVLFPERGRLVVFANGDYGLLFCADNRRLSNFPGGLWYTFFNGSAWSTPVQVELDGTGLGTIAFDSSLERIDTFSYTVLTSSQISNVGSPIRYSQVTHAGVVSSGLTTFGPSASSDGVNHGVISTDAGVIAVPRDDQLDPSNAIWECPINGPYVFTKTILPVPSSPGTQLSCAIIFYTTGPAPPILAGNPAKRRTLPEYIKRRNAPGH